MRLSDITRIFVTSQPEIFYVLNSRWPTSRAYGLQVAKVCQGFKQVGAKVRLVIPIRARHRELKGKDPFALYGVRDRYRIIRLPSLDFTYFHLDGKAFFFIQQFLFALFAAAYLAFRKGVVYSRDPFTLYFLSFIRRRLYWELHRMPEHPRSGVYRRLFSRVRGFVVITEGIKRRLAASGVSASRILVAPDGIDLEEMLSLPSGPAHQRSLGLNPDKHIVGYAGQLLEWKGVDTFVGAAQLLDERFEVFVVGGTPDEIARLKLLDVGNRIRWVGFVPHSEALFWISAADTVVLPNKDDGGISSHYTSPLKMFEYMAAKKSIVASDLPSIREILNDTNAVLVKPDDAESLAAGIRRVADDNEYGGRLARKAREDVERYTWEKRGRRVLEFIAKTHEV